DSACRHGQGRRRSSPPGAHASRRQLSRLRRPGARSRGRPKDRCSAAFAYAAGVVCVKRLAPVRRTGANSVPDQSKEDAAMWTCPKCSKKIDDTFEICWACGTSVDGVEDPHFLDDTDVRIRARANPGLPDEEQTPPESLVTLTKCSLAGEAHAIRVRLESEG